MHESVSIRGQATRSGATDGGRLNSDDGQSKVSYLSSKISVLLITLKIKFHPIIIV